MTHPEIDLSRVSFLRANKNVDKRTHAPAGMPGDNVDSVLISENQRSSASHLPFASRREAKPKRWNQKFLCSQIF